MKITTRFSSAAFLSLFFLGLFTGQLARTQGYTVIDLGTPGNSGSYSDPHGINQSGGVVGEWATSIGSSQAFFYSQGTNTSLSAVAAIAHGINNSNHIVGESGVAATHAFFYTNGTMNDLGTIAGTYSVAWAINNSDQVVGESTTSNLPNPPVHAVWYHGGVKTDLGTLTNGTYSSAFGINDSNVIVGESSVLSGDTYAFICTNSGAMASLGTLGGNYSSARAINNSGQVVGESFAASGETHAFLYSGGVMTDVGTFGGNYSTATAINSTGQVVGYALTGTGDAHAFLFKANTLIDLNNLISSSSVCTNLISADGINDAGQITGSGYTTNGIYHAFLLTPAVTLTASPGLTNGKFMLTVQGAPGQHFAIQASTNFVNWTSLNTNTLVSASTNWLDADVPTNNYRFYRAVMLP